MRIVVSSTIPDTPTYIEKIGEISIGQYKFDVLVKGYGERFHEVLLKYGNTEKMLFSYLRRDLALQRARSIVKYPHKWVRLRKKGGEMHE